MMLSFLLTQQEVAQGLHELAHGKTDQYKRAAYRRAARMIEEITPAVFNTLAETGCWDCLPRIGSSIKTAILQMKPPIKKRFTRARCESVVERFGHLGAVACGSWRRGKATMKDLDFITTMPLNEYRQEFDTVKVAGALKMSGIIDGVPVDLNLADAHNYGAGLLHHTGSAEFNIHCRELAKRKGWKLNQYGLFTNREVVASDEESILLTLGMEWVEPCER